MENVISASVFEDSSSSREPNPVDLGGERGHGEAALALGRPPSADVPYT